MNFHFKNAVRGFFLTLLIAGAIYSGYLFFTTVRTIVAQTSLPFTEGVIQAGSIEKRAPGGQELPDLTAKKERVNILLLGIDQRENDPGPWRTDTMILVSVDPATKSVAMLSIPRDLWVTIPGFGESRINMAHFLGDKHDYPGGGPALAKKTVWYALGVPVHYYVRINFTGFEKLIDAIGGITIDVKKPIHDEKYPDGHYGTMVIDIPAGVQHMDGKTALQYARSRHGTSDFDRMARQQQLILAARGKVLSLDIPISQIPHMLEVLGDSVQTDMPLEEIIALARILKDIPPENIRHGVIDSSMTTTVVTPQKWMVEVADWDKVRKLVDELFPPPVPSVAPTPSLVKDQLLSERARIVLRNGTLTPGLAQRTAQALRDKGFNVVRYENAERFDHTATVILSYTDKRYTVEALAAQLHVSPENIRWENPANAPAKIDIIVILGRDYAQRVAAQQ